MDVLLSYFWPEQEFPAPACSLTGRVNRDTAGILAKIAQTERCLPAVLYRCLYSFGMGVAAQTLAKEA
jgi:hypothetical protein